MVFATTHRALRLRYLTGLYVEELAQKNSQVCRSSPQQVLERIIELTLYAEEKLKSV